MRGLRLGLGLSGGVSSFNPASLFTGGGLGAYFDPNDLSSMYQTGTRAAPGAAAAVDSPVGLLLDKSGNNNDATQATAAARPILRFVGGIYYLALDGVDDHLILPTSLLTGWTSGTGMFAAKMTVDPPGVSGRNAPALGLTGTGGGITEHYPFTDGNVYNAFLSSTRPNCGNPAQSLAVWHVGDFRSATNDWKFALNGTDVFTTATNTVDPGTAPLIGGANGGTRTDGSIGRIIIKNSVLTGGDLSNARTWVGAGAGVIL